MNSFVTFLLLVSCTCHTVCSLIYSSRMEVGHISWNSIVNCIWWARKTRIFKPIIRARVCKCDPLKYQHKITMQQPFTQMKYLCLLASEFYCLVNLALNQQRSYYRYISWILFWPFRGKVRVAWVGFDPLCIFFIHALFWDTNLLNNSWEIATHNKNLPPPYILGYNLVKNS